MTDIHNSLVEIAASLYPEDSRPAANHQPAAELPRVIGIAVLRSVAGIVLFVVVTWLATSRHQYAQLWEQVWGGENPVSSISFGALLVFVLLYLVVARIVPFDSPSPGSVITLMVALFPIALPAMLFAGFAIAGVCLVWACIAWFFGVFFS